jgi:arsenite methyltransferase
MNPSRDIAGQFDAAGARRVEALYLTPDVVAQRARILEALAVQAGERVADLGTGPGLLAKDIAQQAGPKGIVEGIDFSESMVALARRRCGTLPTVSLRIGNVDALPYDDASFDAAVCAQVYEYVPDTERALRELRRVLKPGGRAVIVDTDWESCVWHSSDGERMRRVIDCWNTHCPHPHLPRVLGRMLREAGLSVSAPVVIPLINARFEPDTYSAGAIEVIRSYARTHMEERTVDAWADDLRAVGARGEYFFSLNRYLFTARA